jgi:acyl-CoA hydrolase
MPRQNGKKEAKAKRADVAGGLAGKPVSASRSELTEFVLPNDANALGNMLGGRVMHLISPARSPPEGTPTATW